MLAVKNLKVGFNGKCIIQDLTLQIRSGSFVSIIGPNGCGKSTLVKTIAGLLTPKCGKIEIAGKPCKCYKRREFAKKVAFVMQFSNMVEGMTVRELVSYGRHPHVRGVKGMTANDINIIDWAMEKTNIVEFSDREVCKLSGGEKQRVHLALALAQQPDILILDEPTNHLDLKYQYELLELVKELNCQEGITVLCILHDINQAIRYSDEVVVMDKGQIVRIGSPEECISSELVYQVYGVPCAVNRRNNRMCLDIL